MASSELVFHETQPGVFTRKLAGTEAFVGAFSDTNGFTHQTFTVSVKFARVFSRVELEPMVKATLIRLRHLVPSIALRNSKLLTNEHQFSYRIPTVLNDAIAWASEVLFFRNDPCQLSEAHDQLFNERWWRESDDRYTYEFHVRPTTPSSYSWTFALSTIHSNSDGRSGWMVLDKLFTMLFEEIRGLAPPLESLVWGEETLRLPMSPLITWDVYKTGEPGTFPSVESVTPPPPPKDVLPWLYSPLKNDSTEEGCVFGRICFSQNESNRLHTIGRAHGRTVTQVTTALLSLATAEAALRTAGCVGKERYQRVMDTFSKATHLPSGMNATNMRLKLPSEHQSLDSKYSTPLFCIEGFPLSFPMEPYRKLIQADSQNLSSIRTLDRDVFWNELVKNVADAWAELDMSIEAYKNRSVMYTAMSNVEKVDMSIFSEHTYPTFASFGDMTRLGYLESFRPSSGNDTLIVEDLEFGLRHGFPFAAYLFYEYDGRFQVRSVTGKKFCTEEEMQLRTEVVKELFDALI